MKHPTEHMIQLARDLIDNCEAALNRKLSDGECRDLLKDNTDWSSGEVAIVFALIKADVR